MVTPSGLIAMADHLFIFVPGILQKDLTGWAINILEQVHYLAHNNFAGRHLPISGHIRNS